jgi:hypothetical protein
MALPFWFIYAAARIVYEAFKPRSRPRTTPYAEEKKIAISSSAYGSPIPRAWGTVRLGGNLLWVDPFSGGNQEIRAAFGICVGPMTKLLRIWADGEVAYDARSSTEHPQQLSNLSFTFHGGSESEAIDTDMVYWELDSMQSLTPAYRGLSYIFFSQLSYDHIPALEFEVSTETIADVFWASLDGVAASDTDRDNICILPGDLYAIIASAGIWYRVNILTKTIEFQRTWADPEIPFVKARFDIDENGDIYAIKEGTGGYGVICRIDSDTFSIIDESSAQTLYAQRLRVFRTSIHPYVAFINGLAGTGEYIQVTHRQDFSLGGSDYVQINAPANTTWQDISLDNETGAIWALAKGISPSTASWVSRIVMSPDGSYTQTLTDVTEEPYDWDSIMYCPLGTWGKLILAASYTDGSEQVRMGFWLYNPFSNSLLRMLPAYGYPFGEDFVVTDARWYLRSAFQRPLVNNRLYVISYSTDTDMPTAHCINIWPETYTSVPIFEWSTDLDDSGLDGAASNGGCCYERMTHSMIVVCPPTGSEAANDYIKMYLDKGIPSGALLSDIVTDICTMIGIPAEELDVSTLTDIVPGYLIADRCTAREALADLMDAYLFDIVDSDGKLKCIKRGQASVVSISEDDLAAHEYGGNAPQRLTSTRQQELELPATVEVKYFDRDANYEPAIQIAEKLNTQSKEIRTMNFRIAMTADDAKQIALKTLAMAWIERSTYRFSLGRKYAYLDVGDVVTIIENETTHVIRLIEMEFAAGLINCIGVSQAAAAYESDAEGQTTNIDEPVVDEPGVTLLILIDCPLIFEDKNTLGMLVATLGYTEAWTGATVVKSETGVWTGFERYIYLSNKDATVGKAIDTLADIGDPWIWDEGSSVNVRLLDPSDTLESATELEVLNGANLALLGDEVIAFRNVTQESDGTWTLMGLLRGRKGSEWATGSHAANEYFVLLASTLIDHVELPEDDLSEWRWYRAQTLNSNVFSVTQPFELTGRNMMPLSPQHVAGSRDESGNLTITWIRRTRIGGEWVDGGDASLGETTESYSIDIYDGSTIVRTLTSSTASVVYSASNQTTDFGSVQWTDVHIEVFQISATVGRGFGTAATV